MGVRSTPASCTRTCVGRPAAAGQRDRGPTPATVCPGSLPGMAPAKTSMSVSSQEDAASMDFVGIIMGATIANVAMASQG